MRKVKIQVYGLVQGVGFRYLTKRVADQIPVYGTIQNKYGGSVYIEANGEPEKIERFIERVKKSPSPAGRVDSIDIQEAPELDIRVKFSVID